MIENYFEMNSHAKINLFLEVLNKGNDGYHNIHTLFTEIELSDLLKFSLTKMGGVKIMSPLDCLNNSDNLIYQVGIYIKTKYSVKYGAKIELKKNIPIAAGLGGGSSNAATTIKGLSKLWGLHLSSDEMHKIASLFGSDINFFLEGYLAIGKNRGETIVPLLNDFFIDNILLVNPNYPVTSKEAYELVDPSHLVKNSSKSKKLYYITELLEKQDPVFCFNRLEKGVLEKYPDLEKIKKLLTQLGARKVMLSGSGPTLIAFFLDSIKCNKAREITEEMNFRAIITSTRRRST